MAGVGSRHRTEQRILTISQPSNVEPIPPLSLFADGRFCVTSIIRTCLEAPLEFPLLKVDRGASTPPHRWREVRIFSSELSGALALDQMAGNPPTWDDHGRGQSPLRFGSVSSAAGRSVTFNEDESRESLLDREDHEHDEEWPGMRRRRQDPIPPFT